MAHAEVPYELSFGGIPPTDVAWLHVAQLPMDRYTELTGQEPPETRARYAFLQMTGLGERESALLADVHKDKLEPHNPTLERMRRNLVRAGLDEAQVRHLVDVFALGILVGTETAEITTGYAEQGIRDIESL